MASELGRLGLRIVALMKFFRLNETKELLATSEVNRSARLYVQSSDNRGLRLHARVKRGAIASNVARLWAAINWHYRPTLCADVGANYGEVSLTTRYESGQVVYLFEANPYLIKALKRSIASHRDSDQITLVPDFVGNADGETEFHVDLKWSGTSSAFFRRGDGSYKGGGQQKYESLVVRKTTLSSIMSQNKNERLLLKIDVEGGELEVLQGAKDLLSRMRSYFIVMECNKAILRLKEEKVEEWLREAEGLGRVYIVGKNRVVPFRTSTFRKVGKADLLIANIGQDVLARTALRVVRAGPL